MEGQKSQTLYSKLLEIQGKITGVKKDSTNPFFNSKYFDINKLLVTLRPVLQEHKLILMQPLSNVNGISSITTILHDVDSGECIQDTITLPQLNDPQKMGSAITYYRRYALQSLFLLEALDDDANLASGKEEKKIDHKTEIKKCTTESELRDYLKKHASEKNILLPLLTERKKEILANQ